MDKQLNIAIDVTDWMEQTMKDELSITDKEDLLENLGNGVYTSSLAKAAIVSRELKIAPDDICRPNKTLLLTGAMLDISQTAATQKKKVTVSDGTEYSVRKYIGAPREKQEKQEKVEGEEQEEESREPKAESYVTIENKEEALTRSVTQMERVVTGHIWNRLMEIYACGGDVKNEADKLKQTIDEMVARIVS